MDAPTYLDAYKSLQEGNASAMVLNSTFEDTIAAEDADYAKKLKKSLFLQDPKRSGSDEQGVCQCGCL